MSQLAEIAGEETELEMTPMIDVTFLLLIFFMCTLKFKTLEGKLAAHLPRDVGLLASAGDPLERVEIRLQVQRPGTKLDAAGHGPWGGEGRFTYEADREILYRVGPVHTTSLAELSARLQGLHREDPLRLATIDARQDIVYDDVVRVLDLVMSVGFAECTFVGSYE